MFYQTLKFLSSKVLIFLLTILQISNSTAQESQTTHLNMVAPQDNGTSPSSQSHQSPAKLYVGIKLNDNPAIKTLQTKLSSSSNNSLSKHFIPAPHITLFQGTIGNSNPKILQTLDTDIRATLAEFRKDTTLQDVEVGGLYPGKYKKSGSPDENERPYNIVLNVSHKDSVFMRMIRALEACIAKPEYTELQIAPIVYDNYEQVMNNTPFNSVFNLDTNKYDVNSGLLHITLLTSYHNKLTTTPFEAGESNVLSAFTGVFKNIKDIGSQSPAGKFLSSSGEHSKKDNLKTIMNIILENIIKTPDGASFNVITLMRELTTKLMAIIKGEKSINIINQLLTPFRNQLNALFRIETLKNKKPAVTNLIKKYAQAFLDEMTNDSTDVLDQLLTFIESTETQKRATATAVITLTEGQKADENAKADHLCQITRTNAPCLDEINLSWSSYEIILPK